MARGPMRHIEERIWDLVKAAKDLNFKLVIGHPIVAANDVQRITPPIRPGEHPQMTFYVGQKAWDSFLLNYHILAGSHSILEGVKVEQYTPEQQEGADAEQPGG